MINNCLYLICRYARKDRHNQNTFFRVETDHRLEFIKSSHAMNSIYFIIVQVYNWWFLLPKLSNTEHYWRQNSGTEGAITRSGMTVLRQSEWESTYYLRRKQLTVNMKIIQPNQASPGSGGNIQFSQQQRREHRSQVAFSARKFLVSCSGNLCH